ncbi:uncharacterized protein LOC120353489 [Nilaparvata lugens]|uniref:uncharacterized protein LOC120353489 n=1 Tax=Nilaparvata lugens TaxID=108931 RepID=UPI00193DECDA|nr:uncharacterized protein LOC120353489 [Nilaparvata lugens]
MTLSYKSSITNLKKHMERKHPTVQLSNVGLGCSRLDSASTGPSAPVTDEEAGTSSGSASTSIPLTSGSGSASASTSIPLTSESGSNPSSSRSVQEKPQTLITNFVPRKMTVSSKKKIDQSFLKLFTKDYQPFSIVEDEGFREYSEAMNPSYILPTRKMISNSLVPAAYEQCLNFLLELQILLPLLRFSDIWKMV